MATLAPLTPSRQPFGVLSDVKLRTLQSVKNRQNAITPNSEPSLKRRAPSPELSDSENIDPNVLDGYGKRKRAAFGDDVSLCKPARYNIQITPSAPKPRVFAPSTTPQLDTFQKPASIPLSAPAAAGRSPTRGKRAGLLKSSKRFALPSFGSKSSLSIAEALQGTIVHKKAKKIRSLEQSKPKSWFFEIFEEPEEQQDYRMNEWSITQSAISLDISDDEGKARETSDRGKENIDPDAMSVPVVRSMAAAARSAPLELGKHMETDEPRTPLGDLDPSEYYAEGLDATSVVLVQDEVSGTEEQHVAPIEEPAVEPTVDPAVEAQRKADFTFEAVDKLPHTAHASHLTSDLGAFLAASEPAWCLTEPQAMSTEQVDISTTVDGAIEIWESESARDENEKEEAKLDENDAFTLQEL